MIFFNCEEVPFSNLKGKILIAIDGLIVGSSKVVFKADNGESYQMWHQDDCCEQVEIEDVVGDVSDLIGSQILMAEVSKPDNPALPDRDESYTWTFYKLATQKGYVDIRWYGSSNGYYSEEVSFGIQASEDIES